MIFKKIPRVFLVGAIAAAAFLAPRRVDAVDSNWVGPEGVAANYNQASNWSTGFVPEGGGGNNERAIIGATAGTLNGVATLATTPVASGGLVLGLNPATTGSLSITAGTLNEISTPAATADGRVFVGGGGRGYLTMSGSSILNALGLTIGGENVTTGAGTSLMDLSGSAKVNITGATGLTGLTTISRRLKITGPSVMFTTQRTLRFDATASYTAAITNATTHSPIFTSSNAIVNGTLAVEFSGAGATHSPGAAWTLVDAATAASGISGGFSNIAPGADVPVTGAAAPAPLGSAYRLKTVTGAGRTQLQLALEKVLVLRVNRDTGELSIRNPLGGTISIDNYQVTSPRGSLLASYKGISGAPAGDTNWVKAGPTANFLSEVRHDPANSNTVFNLTAIPSVTLGNGFNKLAIGASTANFGLDGEDLVFEYSNPDAFTIRGQVEYVGTKFENDLVLRVNPTTGHAFLKNDSQTTIKIDGYSIISSTSSLNGGAWTGIGGAWQKSTPATSGALTESNPTGSTTLAPNAQIDIGSIGSFATTPAQAGLSLQFLLAEGFTGLANPPGDLNGSGRTDGDDILVWQRGLGTTYTGNTELNLIRANFGAVGAALPETSFRTGSVVFDATAGVAAAAQVPEPASALMLLAGVAMVAAPRFRRRKHAHQPQARVASGLFGDSCEAASLSGVSTMRSVTVRPYAIGAKALAIVAVLLSAVPALAVTQGIPLTNTRFELPGPTGTKVVAFDAAGVPIPGIIPGWTFVGPGVEVFGDTVPGDSGTEGGGNPGNEMILSTQDGVAYQTSAFNVVSIPATQQYRLSFDAHNIFTIGGMCQLTARLYYDNAGTRTTIGTPLVITDLGGFVNYQITIPGGSAALTPALGFPIGVEFDTTSTELNPAVTNSWAGIDNVLLQISGLSNADFNGDGTINLTDYAIQRDNQQEAHDYLSAGEMTGDGFVNLNDFRAWKSSPAVVASGVLNQIGVPEPSSIALIAMGALPLIRRARRRTNATLKQRRATWVVAAVIAGAAIGTMPKQANATLLYYDAFEIAAGKYTAGPLLGQNPTVGPTSFFSGAWQQGSAQPTDNQVVATGMSFLGAPALGGSATVGTTGQARMGRNLTTPLDATTVGTYYLSFVVNYGSLPVGSTPSQADFGHRAIEFWQAGGSIGSDANLSMTIGYMGYNGGAGAANQISTTARMRFLLQGAGDQVIENSPFSFNLDGATHLVVLKMQMTTDPVVAGVGGDTVSLYLDPTTSVEGDLPPPSATGTGLNFTLGAMSGPIHFGANTASPETSLDEIRVADTWASVVPDFPTPGDTNGDHLVDLVDYNNIITHFGQQVTTALEGDVALHSGKQGSDGRVDIGDYRIWRDHRTDVPLANPVGAPVPEPAGVALAISGVLALAARRRRANASR